MYNQGNYGGYQQPAYGQQKPAYGQQQQAYGYQQPAYGQQQQAYGYQQPAYGQQQQAYGYQQQGYGAHQLAHGVQQQMMPGQGGYGNYRNQNWGNYQCQTYAFNVSSIDRYAEQLFLKHDRDRSGTIDIFEFPPMLTEFYQMQGLNQYPSMQDTQYLMWMFDLDGDGEISFWEFKRMLKQIGGHKTYNQSYLYSHRNNHTGKGKYNKHQKQKKHNKHNKDFNSIGKALNMFF